MKASKPAKPPSPTLLELLPQYLDWQRVQHLSPHTVYACHMNLNLFIGWAECRDIMTVDRINHALIERYQRHLFYYRKPKKTSRSIKNPSMTEDASTGQSAGDGGPLTPATQLLRLVHLRGFFAWMTKHGHIGANPAADLSLPKTPKALPKDILTHEETERILAMPDTETVLGIRNRAMLELLYATGMRRMEVLRMGMFDLDIPRQTIHIREGKGKKDRVVPISPRAIQWLERYMRESREVLYGGVLAGRGSHPLRKYRPNAPTLPAGARAQDVMFLTKYGEPFRLESLGVLVSGIMRQAGIAGKKVSCHSLRHSVATGMLEHGADIRYIQQMLGHAKLETTEIYTRVRIEKLKEVYNQTHPTNVDAREREARREQPVEGSANDKLLTSPAP